jgi:penicillin-binding protein 2
MPLFKRRNKNSYGYQEIELEDIFLDKLIMEKSESSEIWERKIEVPLRKKAFWFLWGLVIAVVAVLAYVSFTMQVQSFDRFRTQANNNQFMVAYLSASRGIIYDSEKRPLVKNEASFDLWFHQSQTTTTQSSLEELSKIIHQDAKPLGNILSLKNNSAILIKKNLTHDELILFEAKQNDFPGFSINKGILRIYENQKALGPILGYLGKIDPEQINELTGYQLSDEIGKEGLEKFYEETLKEQKGEFQVEHNARGEEISKKIVEYPKSGNSLILALDLDLQAKMVEVLQQVSRDVGAKKTVALALNPQTGGILASVSLPSYDNNLFSQGISVSDFNNINQDKLNPLLNRVISGLYPTGSAIKPFIASAALEEKIITENTSLWCPLKICLENRYSGKGECFVDNKFHGTSDVKRAIAESVNPFFYLIGGGYTAPKVSSEFYDPLLPKQFTGLGVSKIDQYLQLFGFGTSSGVDLPGELPGRVPSIEWKQKYFKTPADQIWFQGDTYNLSIGQGYLLATPLQLATAISAIANNGKLIQPHFAQAIQDSFGNTIKEFSPTVIRENFIAPNNIRIVREGMRQTVNSAAGSALSLNNLPVKVAAKTGTAQIGKGDVYENWIVTFAPYDNPTIVLLVLIEEVPGIQPAAQRTAREVLDWYFLTHPVK